MAGGGVLGLYSVRPDAFDADDEAVAHILARHLRRYSQDTNTKLRDVAPQLIDTRRLPS